MATADQFITYVTAAGDRWDLIGDLMYGDATNFAGIIAANPAVLIEPVLPLGTVLLIPVIDPPPATTPTAPWATEF